VSDELPETPAAYRARVMLSVMNAVVAAGSIDGLEEGMVEMDAALDGICDAIVMLVAGSGLDKTPKDRRDTADRCRKRILTHSNEVARRVATGEHLPWTMNPIGDVH
jgi:hypothetical protein